MAKYSFNGRRSAWKGLLLGCIVAVLLAGAGGIGTYKVYKDNLKPLNASQRGQVVTVESGWTVKQIADKLESSGIIRKSWAFQWYVRNNNLRDKLQAGSYALKPSQGIEEIVNIISKGNIVTNLVTILPGKRLDEIRDKLINDGFAASEVDAALDPTLYVDHAALVDKPREASLEGYLYPESFQRTSDTKPSTIIRASLDQMQKHLTPELRAGIVRQGLTVHEGVILASIIEREVTDENPEDRPKVAQVFLKRLRIGMLLQSDATASYGKIDNPEKPNLAYNTYVTKGLTPTPISNVTKSSLAAVASPASTDFLYFVSGDNDINYFSQTVEEHEALVEQYCKKKCGR